MARRQSRNGTRGNVAIAAHVLTSADIEHEDELFPVVNGRFTMQVRDRDVVLEEGEFLIVPRGVEHRPVAEHEVHVLLFEPAATVNTGNVVSERTVVEPARV